MSLFQEHNPAGRTDTQTASFKRALKSINIWYASATTMVWRLTKLPPAPRPGHDINPYELRGWCFFELAVMEMITPGGRVLDLEGRTVGGLEVAFEPGTFRSGWHSVHEFRPDDRPGVWPEVQPRCRRGDPLLASSSSSSSSPTSSSSSFRRLYGPTVGETKKRSLR